MEAVPLERRSRSQKIRETGRASFGTSKIRLSSGSSDPDGNILPLGGNSCNGGGSANSSVSDGSGWVGMGSAPSECGNGAGAKNNALALSGGRNRATWSLDELIQAFETDRVPHKWRRGDDDASFGCRGGDRGVGSGGGDDGIEANSTATGGRLSIGRVSGGTSDWSGGGSEGRRSGPVRGAAPPAIAAHWRTERETRAIQVQFMRERVEQLRRAVKEGRLKPIGSRRLFKVQCDTSRRGLSVYACFCFS